MQKGRYTYLNGKIVPHNKARIPVDDISIARAFGVYDGIFTVAGKPFELTRHYKRLSKSADLLGLRVPVSERELDRVIRALIKKNSFKQPIVRVLLTGGTTLRGIDFDPKKPTFIVMLEEKGDLGTNAYKKGVSVITHVYERQLPEAKTINYIAAVRLQPAMRKAKATEALYVSHSGHVLEATTSNLFIVKKGVVITPRDGILNGITRQLVIELAEKHYRVTQKPLSLRDVFGADEVFLTSSFKDVLPVVKVDGKRIAKGTVGPTTKHLIAQFADYLAKAAKN